MFATHITDVYFSVQRKKYFYSYSTITVYLHHRERISTLLFNLTFVQTSKLILFQIR
jgi:hypothetical protein